MEIWQKIFPPETERIDQLKPASSAIGGTIILRHWWYPAIKGVLDNPRPNTTWYASTLIWSDADDERPFWISFDDISRSHATASPGAGTWDERKSALWVNDTLIPPPLWKHAGKKSDLELPLIDEGYAYRKPTVIKLKKGWNKVLVKLPVGGFTAGDWNNPVKWMFTFAPANL
jgi:hexosaminidase